MPSKIWRKILIERQLLKFFNSFKTPQGYLSWTVKPRKYHNSLYFWYSWASCCIMVSCRHQYNPITSIMPRSGHSHFHIFFKKDFGFKFKNKIWHSQGSISIQKKQKLIELSIQIIQKIWFKRFIPFFLFLNCQYSRDKDIGSRWNWKSREVEGRRKTRENKGNRSWIVVKTSRNILKLYPSPFSGLF